ncbi:MAG: MerR family transcriptional regulator [Gammaproteobacteria bacterium]|nr:MerR family transcriptional regulator [Gammaproteobacteria bacterium]
MSSSSDESHEQTYGIGAVAKLTGLSDHTIRVWERRYQAVVARRSPNGRRVYTTADVEKLNLLKLLTDRGLSIGRIAGESREELKSRVESITELSAAPAPSNINVAILGDFLPAKISAQQGDLSPLSFVIVDTSAERFMADITQHPVDVLILESPVVDDDTVEQLQDLMTTSGARRAAFVYSFARTQDMERLRNNGTVLLRAPIDIDELRTAIVSAYEAPSVSVTPKRAQEPAIVDADWAMDTKVEPRRFSQEQLTALANVSSAIECECPRHLADLVGDLTAFEIYSANCANRNDEDAALHRYLHQTTAQARALIEKALERVAKAEGLSY